MIYHLDYLAMVLSIIGLLLNARKNVACWPVWFISTVLWTWIGWRTNQPALGAMQFIFCLFNIWGWYSWRRDTKPNLQLCPSTNWTFGTSKCEHDMGALLRRTGVDEKSLADCKSRFIENFPALKDMTRAVTGGLLVERKLSPQETQLHDMIVKAWDCRALGKGGYCETKRSSSGHSASASCGCGWNVHLHGDRCPEHDRRATVLMTLPDGSVEEVSWDENDVGKHTIVFQHRATIPVPQDAAWQPDRDSESEGVHFIPEL